ncbi:MAG: DUF177 domain-containing protein [Selenomonadaceae bacterium]|nr:DUF177 domain-containing protein [Selenomonadaceae bacterium]
MLKVQISRGGSVPFEFKVAADFFCGKNFLDNGSFIGDIQISGEIINDGLKFVARGKIKCRKQFSCDRCLTQSTVDQDVNFDEELERADIVDDYVELTELVRDNLIASQPIQNLCRADCKGLCPVCGKNLNDGACECETFTVDPRLAPLINLKSFEEV